MFECINNFDRVFCIFTGNSINEISESVWNKLDNECVIGINHSFKIYDRPTYFFFNDKDVLYAFWNHYKNKSKTPITYCNIKAVYGRNKVDKKYPEVVPKKWIDKNIDEFWTIPDMNKIVNRSWNITPIWLLATLKNLKYNGKIYLIGADFYIDKDDTTGEKKYHFQNYHKDYYKKRKLDEKLDRFRNYLENPYWKTMHIYNCNPKSKLVSYPFVNLEKLLDEK
jgi:hypothetical protein